GPPGLLLGPDRGDAIEVCRRGAEVPPASREELVRVVVVVEGQADLLEIVGTLGPGRRLPHFLDGRQEQADEDRDDRDHHQQLNEREAWTRNLRNGSAWLHRCPRTKSPLARNPHAGLGTEWWT